MVFAWIGLIVLLILAAVAFNGMRGKGGWNSPSAGWRGQGRIPETIDEEDFEKPRNEGDLL